MAKKKTPDDDPVVRLGRLEATNDEFIYHDPLYDNYVVLLLNGEEKDHSGPRFGEQKTFNIIQEARAYLDGVQDAMDAQDLTLEAVSKEDWFVEEDAGDAEGGDDE